MGINTIIITEQGTRLTKKGYALILFKQREKIFVYPMANLERIVIMGRVEIAAALIGLLLRKNIEVVFLSYSGNYKGRLCGTTTKNVFIRKIQFDKQVNEAFRIKFSKEIIRGKVKNYARMIQKSSKISYSIFEQRLKNMLRSLDTTDNLQVIRGLEGSFSALYFKYFPSMLINRFGFSKRIKHPPPDPVNILLSFGYTLLFNNVYAFVESAGMDPYVGFFHELSYGHPALVSDLMEQFRAPVVDSLVISMINLKQIKQEDFQLTDKCELKKESIGKFVDNYRKKISKKFKYRNRQYNYLQIIEEQVRKFVRYLEEKDEQYQSFEYR